MSNEREPIEGKVWPHGRWTYRWSIASAYDWDGRPLHWPAGTRNRLTDGTARTRAGAERAMRREAERHLRRIREHAAAEKAKRDPANKTGFRP